METIKVYGAKGGVGTSTAAAALAVYVNGTLVSPDAAPILGDAGNLPMVRLGDGPIVNDHGVLDTEGNKPDVGDDAILITTCCYLALRSAMRCDLTGFRGVVVVEEPGRALAPADVAEVLGLEVLAIIPRDPAIARTVDAGLLVARLPRVLALPMVRLAPLTIWASTV